jgi:hypothetical protein
VARRREGGVIHLVCVFGGGDVALLPHLVRHYRGLGIESFRLIRHAEHTDDPEFALAEQYARACGVELFHTHVGPWDQNLNERITEYVMSLCPDDWYAVVDLDEFQVYDRPPAELVALCERDGYEYVTGCFLDRVAADGSFPSVDGTSPWQRYPLAGSVGAGLAKALPLKATLARGRVGLLSGHHGAADGTALPAHRSFAQVHHFKWTGTVVERMRRRVRRFETGSWKVFHPAVIKEARTVLGHIEANGGRIDVRDERLRLQPCGSSYDDHPHWKELADEAHGWSWTLTY